MMKDVTELVKNENDWSSPKTLKQLFLQKKI